MGALQKIRSLTHTRRDILVHILLILSIGTAVTVAAHRAVRGANEKVVVRRLDALAAETASQVKERIRTYEYGLRGVRGAIVGASVEGMNRDLFRNYAGSRNLEEEFAGSRGMGYILRVAPDAESLFVERVRREGRPDFAVLQLAPHGDERYVIVYIEPEFQNSQAIGLDIASDKARAKAARIAMDTGSATLTEPITLVQAMESPKGGFLFLLPVYRRGILPETGAAADVVGWAYMPLVIDEVLKSLIDRSAGYELTLYDATEVGAGDDPEDPGLRFYRSSPARPQDNLRRVVHIELYARKWAVEVAATPAFLLSLNQQNPWVISLALGLIAALAYALGAIYRHSRARKRVYALERERLASLVENSSDAIIGHTRSGIISAWNRSAEALFGFDADHAVGKSYFDLVVLEQNRKTELVNLNRILSGKKIASYSTVCATSSGSPVDVSMAMSPIRGPDGKILGAMRTIRNIGEEKSFEAKLIALNNSLERSVAERTADLDERNKQLEATSNGFLQIIESAPYALIMVGRDGRISVFNAMAERIFGFLRSEMIGQPIEILIPERFAVNHVRFRSVFAEKPEARPMGRGRELSAMRKDGTEFPVEIGLSPVETPSGTQVLAAIIDISMRREHERLLEQYGAFQEAILSNAGFSIIATDPEGIITLFNPAAERMLGYSSMELVGKKTPLVIHLEEEIAARADALSLELGREIATGFECFAAKARSGFPDEFEWTYVRKDGSRIPVLLNISSLTDKQGAIIGYLGIAVDLTERNENARQLRAYSEGLSEMVASKSLELQKAQERLLYQERLQRDLELAAVIQKSLLPQSPPQTDRYDIAMYAKPARFVSGDVYDMVTGQDGQLFLFLADVSGKGIPAAIMASSARTLFRQGVHRSPCPKAILEEIEGDLSDDLAQNEMFMTCQICRFDHRTGDVSYVNAGHTESYVYRPRDNGFSGFSPTNLPVGLRLGSFETAELSASTTPGDILVFYSDGLTELSDDQGRFFGEARLKETITRYGNGGASQVMEGILEELQRFGGEREAEDDVTIVVVRVLPSAIETEWEIRPEEYDGVVASLTAACGRYGRNFAYEVDLMASELLSNIVRHAYGIDLEGGSAEREGGMIALRTRLCLETAGIRLDVYDRGTEFRGDLGNPAMPESLSEGGYGIGIVSSLSDEVGYSREPEGSNHWRIVKTLKERNP